MYVAQGVIRKEFDSGLPGLFVIIVNVPVAGAVTPLGIRGEKGEYRHPVGRTQGDGRIHAVFAFLK